MSEHPVVVALRAYFARLSLVGTAASVVCLVLMPVAVLLYVGGNQRAADTAALRGELQTMNDTVARLKNADARQKSLQDALSEVAAQRQKLIAPLLTLESSNPPAVVLDAASTLGVPLTTVRADKRAIDTLNDIRLEYVDVNVQLTAGLEPSLAVLERVEAVAQGRIFLRGLSLTYTPQGWRTGFGYRVHRRAGN